MITVFGITFDVVSLIYIVAIAVLFVASVSLLSLLLVKNNKLRNEKAMAEIEKVVLLTKITQLMNSNESSNVENTEGFLRFISQSRDWAFQYIEDLQAALVAYRDATIKNDPNEISSTYKALVKFLPEDKQ